MSKVEYHVIREPFRITTPMLICRLTQDHYRAGRTVYIRTPDQKQSANLDKLLWTFEQGGFVPHRLAADKNDPAPVVIGEALPEPAPEVFINLAREVPPNCQRFPWILEVVDPDPKETQAARERYRRYRELGCEVTTQDA
jgi:DNA polymerase IIIc chi subunit